MITPTKIHNLMKSIQGDVTAKQLAVLFNCDPYQVTRRISELKSLGIVEQIGTTRSYTGAGGPEKIWRLRVTA